MYNNIVYQLFQNYYDTSMDDLPINISSHNRDISSHNRDISSTNISILMERIFDNTQNNALYNTYDICNQLLSNQVLSNQSFFRDISNNTYILNDEPYNVPFIPYRLFTASYIPVNRRFSFINYFVNALSQNNALEENAFLENFINSTFENSREKFKKVISDYDLEKLKPQKFIKKNESEKNCQ